jgi:hypothetical protein
MPDCHALQDHARTQVRLGRRVLEPGADKGVAAMLTCASWIIQRLPDRVVERQRSALIRALAEARDLVVEVAVGSKPTLRIRDGAKLLVEIPAKR